MNLDSFESRSKRYPRLRIAVVGDYFLDRYLLIDPQRAESSIETGLTVHNVVDVRAQPGAAGTILNNLVALGVGTIHVVGFRGDDGEGYELERALKAMPGVELTDFLTAPRRRTPVYCKPLVIEPGNPPRELNRFDGKNWTPTPEGVQHDLAARVEKLVGQVDAMILMDQVDLPETGVVTRVVREAAHSGLKVGCKTLIVADSRRGLHDYPALAFKMNAIELGRMNNVATPLDIEAVMSLASSMSRRNNQPVFVTLAENGIVGAVPGRPPEHVAALPVRGTIDVVGAGDAVTANLTAALASGCELRQSMAAAMAAASIVIHQLGTTGTAMVPGILGLLGSPPAEH